MDSGSSSSGRDFAVSFQPELERQIEKWRELLAECASKPSQKRIHTLRTLTLRIPVRLEYCLRVQAQESSAVTALTRWIKLGKKLRKELQPIRNSDVYLLKLKYIHEVYSGSDDNPKLSPRCLCERDKLESRLKIQRHKGEDRLLAFIGAHGKKLRKLSIEMQMALAPFLLLKVDSTAQPALGVFAQLARDLPELNDSNLHAFRKRLKAVLYLAETSAGDDPLAKRLVTAFKEMSVVIGDWHDWKTLALEAGDTLRGHAKRDGLVPLMEKLADDALEKALVICKRYEVQLLIKGVSDGSGESLVTHPSRKNKNAARVRHPDFIPSGEAL